MGFRLRLHAYCGMYTDIVESGDKKECRDEAARKIREHRADDGPVSVLVRGYGWELQTPDDAAMISDGDGILEITNHCDECEKQVSVDLHDSQCDDCFERQCINDNIDEFLADYGTDDEEDEDDDE